MYQTRKTVFEFISKHRKESRKYDTQWSAIYFWRTSRRFGMWSYNLLCGRDCLQKTYIKVIFSNSQKTSCKIQWTKMFERVSLSYTAYCQFHLLKPWPNGLASRRKLKTWVYLRLRLARPCVHLHWLAMTCAHFGRDQICTQVKVSLSPFGYPTQVNASWMTSINLL